MEQTQLTLRVHPTLLERLHTYAKANKLSVNKFTNNLLEKALTEMVENGGANELTQLLSAPVKTLSNLHHKLCDPWNTGSKVNLSDAEIDFLIDGAKKLLDHKHLVGPFYDEVREKLINARLLDDMAFFRLLYGFAHRLYLKDEIARNEFAAVHAHFEIPSTKYHFTINNITFSLMIQGNEGTLYNAPEARRPPVLNFICETAQFDSHHDWNTFIALVRLMDAVYVGRALECHSGPYTRLSRRMDSEKPWSLFLGRLQLLLTDTELQQIAVELNRFVKNEAANIIKQIRLLYGEG